MNTSTLAKELFELAQERARNYPVKLYPNRKRFEQKLDELAVLAIEQANKIKIDDRVLSVCEGFRNYPVFLCGYFKTGTSLLNSLLDYHPQALVLLPDSKVLFNVRKKAEKLSKEDYFLFLAKEYVRTIYNPTGHLPMNLYSSAPEELNLERYAHFVAYLKHFIISSNTQAELLSALPCAVFASNGQFSRGHRPRLWVEKTPTNERYISQAKALFPKSKFVFIARNPYDNLASIKRWYLNSKREQFSGIYLYFMGLRKSLKTGISSQKRDDFYFVKYEDIVADPRNQMQKIAYFLGIFFTDSMTVPTIMGIEDRPNTSDIKEKNKDQAGKILQSRVARYKADLTEKEIKHITVAFAGLLKKLGYTTERVSGSYKFFMCLPLKIKALLFRVLVTLRSRNIRRLPLGDKT